MARRLVPVVLIAALAAAGCGSAQSVKTQQHQSTKPKTANFVELAAKSAARTQAAGSAHISMSVAMRVAGSNQEGFSMRGGGDVTYKPQAASMTMKIASGVPQLSGTMREVMIGTKMYMNWPLLSAQIPGHKPWIEEDLGAIGSAMGMNLSGMMNQRGASNPAQMLSYLRGLASMKEVGPATVDGVATTEYSGTVDYTKLVTKGLIDEKALNLIRTEMGRTTVPVKVWLDGGGMLRQMQMHMQMTTPNGPTMLMQMQFQMSKYGEKVHIAAPPAGQVFDATKLAVSGISSGSGSSS
jgi:hypothetical protein